MWRKIAAVISAAIFVVVVGVVQLIAKMFGGRGTFDQLAYAIAAIATPVALIDSLFTHLFAVPYVMYCGGLLSFLLFVYTVVLEVMAVKGVNQFGRAQLAASLLLPFIVVCCCHSVGVIGVLRALEPGINQIFNSIQQSLPTP